MQNILIVDDELLIREVIKEYGNLYQYNVLQAGDGLQAIEIVKNNDIDCIILDIMMPQLDGYATCKEIKNIKDIPIIMLSARSQEEDKLYGFENGIDDYVTKPFSPKELMARVKVCIERNKKEKNDVLIYQDLVIDLIGHQVKINKEDIHLTNKEYDLLVYFLKNSNVVVSRETLINQVWGEDSYSLDRTVDAHIKMLRKNIKNYSKNIVTVRGIGYKFEKE